ncbi:MAG TPA: bifunctional metallophosphatase/5'-nucleotidase [Burkholderiales bacterium]|nr:bifunctional metallophosphatase/5'-nucleotidase [Burkholderiales bacterium]
MTVIARSVSDEAIPERPGRAALFALALLLAGCTTIPTARILTLNLAAINDFHGHLHRSAEPVAGRPLGDVARLATVVADLRARSAHFAFVSAGDLVGASPVVSAAFNDEPTIEAMNAAGLDFNGVGNHEFDAGLEHIQRLQSGGCPPGGCRSGSEFAGARFRFLAANVVVRTTGEPLFPAYAIREYAGVKVAFVGMTLEGTAEISAPANVERVDFRDEADTVNALVPVLKQQGVEAIVVLIHQGGVNRGGPNECAGFEGPIRDLVARMDRAVDLVVSGHTHQAYVCNLDGRLVTSAGSYGRYVTHIELDLDPKSRDVIAARAENRIVSPDVAPHAAVAAVVERYTQLAAPLRRVVGLLTAPLERRASADGESPLGQTIADAHLASARGAGAVVAFMNPGGIRAPLDRGEVTFAQVFDLYPFNNAVVAMTLTGAQILALLEQQWGGDFPRILQVSQGFSYAWNPGAPNGSRVVRGSVTLNGEPVVAEKPYRIAVNSYLAQGGDRFSIFRDGVDRVEVGGGRDAIASYLEAASPYSPPSVRRIRRAGRAGP